MRQYVMTALANARSQELDYEDVLRLDYPGLAALAGVVLGPGGTSPADYFWRQIRKRVANVLMAEQFEARRAAAREELQAAARRLYPRATVVRDTHNKYVVNLRGDELAPREARQ